VRLVIRDFEGKVFLDTDVMNLPVPMARELYDLARRIALNVDEKVDETVQLLDQL
jgi:hypothetical protein